MATRTLFPRIVLLAIMLCLVVTGVGVFLPSAGLAQTEGVGAPPEDQSAAPDQQDQTVPVDQQDDSAQGDNGNGQHFIDRVGQTDGRQRRLNQPQDTLTPGQGRQTPLLPAIPPQNPLVIAEPTDRTGNPTVYYNRNGRPKLDQSALDVKDYTQDYAQERAARTKPLPLFGYGFFQSARQIIDARRLYLRRQYGLAAPTGALSAQNGLTMDNHPYQRRPDGTGTNYITGGGAALMPPAYPDDRSGSRDDLELGLGDQNDNAPPGQGNGVSGRRQGLSDSSNHGNPDDGNDQNDKETQARNQELAPAAAAAAQKKRRDALERQQHRTAPYDMPQEGGTDSEMTPDAIGQGDAAQGDFANGNRSQEYAPQDDRGSAADSAGNGYSTYEETNVVGSDNGQYNPTPEDLGAAESAGAPYTTQGQYSQRRGAYPGLSANDQTLLNNETPYQANGGAPGQGEPYNDQGGAYPPETMSAGVQGRYQVNPPPVDAYHEVADPLSQLYRNVSATVPGSYQLSAGDVLTVRYWSPTMAPREATVTVDLQDAVMIPGVGRFVVRGLTAAQAEHTLRERLRRLYNNADVSITLREARTIPVTVSGEAYAPGTYNVPAVASAFNVLYAAGGPTEDGTLRTIEVRRAGRLVGILDVYGLLLGIGKFTDIPLQSGDLIVVPPRLSRIAVKGEVRQPALYELKDNETLNAALRFARGVKPSGVAQHVEVNTLVPGTARVLKDVNLKDKAQVAALPLYDGDTVDVFSLRSTLTNRVTVAGAVDQPGDYALESGMRVADLLERARGPIPEAYLPRADLYRWNPDNTTTLIPVNIDAALTHDPAANVPLMRWDRLQVYTRQEVAWTGQRDVTVRGAVQRPGVYTRSENMHVRDLLLKAGGPTPEASLEQAVLLHQHADGSFDYSYVGLGPDAGNDPLLQDNDVLAVYTTRQAQFTANHIVTVLGEVVAPGPYPRGDGMRLSDLLRLAGGFRPGAITRVDIAHAYKSTEDPEARPVPVTASFDAQENAVPGDDVTLQDGDVVTVQGTGGFHDHVSVVMVKGAVNHPGPVIITDKMRLSDAIRAAGGLRDVAFPDGADFTRQPEMMATTDQRSLSQVISSLNDLINNSAYGRELAKSDIERIQGAQSASQVNNTLLPIGGVSNTAAGPSPAAAALGAQLAQHNLVSPPRRLGDADLQPNGNIAVNLPAALRRPGANDDILLVDGDTVTVPERPTTVQVVGAVFNPRGVMYKPDASLDYYVAQAGGFAPDAASDRIEIIHAGGGLIPAGKVRALQPGDMILVPTRVLAEKLDHGGNKFTEFFQSLTSGAIVYKVLTSVFGL